MAQTLYKSTVLTLFVLLAACARSYTQTNTFSYLTWNDKSEWKAAVVKIFNPSDSLPQIKFLHSKVIKRGAEQTHYDDYINYLSDAGDRWQATIWYNPDAGTFYFTHCKNGGEECHDDVIMNYRHISGESRQLTIEPSSLKQFKSSSKQIVVKSKFLGRWNDEPTATSNTTNEVVYIDWATEHCGCTSNGEGFKHYLHNATGNAYKVTVQTTAYSTPGRMSTHDYTIKPGEEIYIGCSQAQSQGCFGVDFAIINQVKQ